MPIQRFFVGAIHESPACNFPPPTAPANILRLRTAPRPPLVRGGGFLSGQKAGGVVKHFRFLTWLPAGGVPFLRRQERNQRIGSGEALQMWSIHRGQKSKHITPTPKRPPLGPPPAATRQLNAQRSGFIVGECCRAQRIFNLNDCRWQSYLDS